MKPKRPPHIETPHHGIHRNPPESKGIPAQACSPFLQGVYAALADHEGEQGDGGQNPFKGDRQKSDAWMRGYYRVSHLLKSEANRKDQSHE